MCSSHAERSLRRVRLWPLVCGLAVVGCQADLPDAQSPRTDTPTATPAEADSSRIGPGELQPYAYTVIDSAHFDADGDGASERIQLLATVERNERGELLWEDGHHWAVLVLDDSVRYPLFERFLPWGRAELLLLRTDAPRPVIVVQTRAPARCGEDLEQTLAIHVERFTFEAATRAFLREVAVDVSGTGVCLRGDADDGSDER